MIPNTKDRAIASSGVAATGEFGISLKDSAHIMTILRDTMYSDKVMAVLREYSANAWDSHKEAGKGDVPIDVTLPTAEEPTLSIKDHGLGLSREDVFQVYTQYGASTKRASDSSVGMLGIGCKSAFAYSDSFLIVSCHGGTKSTYVAALDASEKGILNLLAEEPCGEETGVEIKVAVRTQDISEFREKAVQLYQYFDPRPNINVDLPHLSDTKLRLENGVIYDTDVEGSNYRSWSGGKWVAVMGCVPYRINMGQLSGLLPSFVEHVCGAVYFKIGEVKVNASREELKYDDSTKAALAAKFTALLDEYVLRVLTHIEKSSTSPWDKRLRSRIFKRIGLPVPDLCKGFSGERVRLYEPATDDKEGEKSLLPETIRITQDGKRNKPEIVVEESTVLVIWDTNAKSTRRYNLPYNAYLVKRTDKGATLTYDQVRKEVDDLCEKLQITGIKVARLSEVPISPVFSSGSTFNPKHVSRYFYYAPTKRSGSRDSDAWESIHGRTPTPNDVFVILEAFIAYNGLFHTWYREDAALAESFGVQMPLIYGYKNTKAKPVAEENCVGTPYEKWRVTFTKSLITDKTKRLAHVMDMSGVVPLPARGERRDRVLQTLDQGIGSTHKITRLIRTQFLARRYYPKYFPPGSHLPSSVNELRRRFPDEFPPPLPIVKEIFETYPLLGNPNLGIASLWGEYAKEVAVYVNAVDSALSKKVGP